VSKDAITYSKAKKTFKDWRIQKARHITTAPMYAPAAKAKLGFGYFSQYYFYLSLLALAFRFETLLLIPVLLVLKMIVQLIILNKASKKLNEKDLLWPAMLYELILLFIYPIFHLTKLFYKPNKWSH